MPTPEPSNLTSLWLLAAVAAGFAAMWIGFHLAIPRIQRREAVRGMFAVRAIVGILTWWLCIQTAGRLVTLNGGGVAALVAILGGVATEAIVALYTRERETVRCGSGRWLLALRLVLMTLVLVTLLQPVLTYRTDTWHERCIAVLLDDSASMQLADPQSSPAEKLELARLFEPSLGGRPLRLEEAARELADLRRDFETHLGWLRSAASAPPETVVSGLRHRRQTLIDLTQKAENVGETQRRNLAEAIARLAAAQVKVKGALESLRARSAEVLGTDVVQARRLIEAGPGAAPAGSLESLRAQFQKIVGGLQQLEEQIVPLPASVAEARFASLKPSEIEGLDKLTRISRQAIARSVLLAETSARRSLLNELGKNHAVKFYRFASNAKAVDLQSWRTGETSARGSDAGPQIADWRQATDLAGALNQVQQDIPADHLAGLLVLSDGRHNHGAPAEPLAQVGAIGRPRMLGGDRLPGRPARRGPGRRGRPRDGVSR